MASSSKPSTSTLSLADQVRSIAQEGLKHANDPYDKARYEALLEIAIAPVAAAVELDFKTLLEKFREELGAVTPKIGVDAAVLDGEGRLLVLDRVDKTGWCLPCGWVNVGEDPAIAAVREVREETGLRVEALGCISISTKGPGKTQNIYHQVNLIIMTKLLSPPASLKLSHEHTDFKWIDEKDVLPWHVGHDRQLQRIFKFLKSDKQSLLAIDK